MLSPLQCSTLFQLLPNVPSSLRSLADLQRLTIDHIFASRVRDPMAALDADVAAVLLVYLRLHGDTLLKKVLGDPLTQAARLKISDQLRPLEIQTMSSSPRCLPRSSTSGTSSSSL